MAERERMTAEQVVGYLLEGEGLDFWRESLGWVVQQFMEAEVSELVGRRVLERASQPSQLVQLFASEHPNQWTLVTLAG